MSSYSYSSFTSPYHRLFCEIGYPQLDVRFIRYDDEKTGTGYETGEWAIYQMLNAPVIPHRTQWCDVMTGLKNLEINKSNLLRLCESIDITKQAIWDREMAKTKAIDDEADATSRHREDIATRMSKAITQNPDLVERIATHGIGEIDPRAIIRHIPRSRRSY